MDTLLIATARERALGVSDRVLLGALDYVLRERVADGVVRDGRVAARILGARDEYRVEARLDPFTSISCSCSLRPPCRHGAAAVVAYLRHPEWFAVLPAGESALADAVFALVAGRADPMAALRPAVVADGAGSRGEPDWSALAASGGRAALDALLRFLEPAADGAATAIAPEAGTRAAQALRGLVAFAPRCSRELARRLARLYLALPDPVLAVALGAFLHALDGEPLEAVRAAAEHAAWAAADLAPRAPDAARALVPDRARRALDWLCEHARGQGGEEEALKAAQAHRGLPGAAWQEATSLWRQGRVEQAARVAQGAYLHARDVDAERLYALLGEMGRKGQAGVVAFLRSAWEADPEPARLDELLAMGNAEVRDATRAAAGAVLARRHRFDILTQLARRERDLEAAVRWAVRDGVFAAQPGDCEALAETLAGERPLLAIELLGAAYRREPEPERRRRIVARARALERASADLRQAWPLLRRRWFPEPGQGPVVGPS